MLLAGYLDGNKGEIMEIALGIFAVLFLYVLYLPAFKGIDYSEKGNNKKTY